MNSQAGVAGQEASVGPARLARAPTRSSQIPQTATLDLTRGGASGGLRGGGRGSCRMGLGVGGVELEVA